MPTLSPGLRASSTSSPERVSCRRIARIASVRALNARHSERRDALAATDEAHPLAAARLDVDARALQAERLRQTLANGAAVRPQARLLHQHGAVDVDDLKPTSDHP